MNHRALVLGALIVIATLWLAVTLPAAAMFRGGNLAALGVVVIAAAAAGIAFSWRRYRR
jgi:hypothetical protein